MAAEEAGGDRREADGPAALTDDGGTEWLRRSVEFSNCSIDAAYFLDAFGIIDDAQGLGEGGGTTPFALWPAQIDVMWTLMSERQTVVLKARQLGLSWLCCGYALWRCLFEPGQMVLLFSRGQLEADEMLRRVRVLYERLPDWFRAACPLAREPNMSQLEWRNGSRVLSLPATKHSGSSWTASLAILDEAAKIPFADDLYTALKPTIDGGGQLIVLSTANGIGNLFHKIWTKAAAGVSGFRSVFLAWWERPGRNQAWYDAKVADETDPARVRQEYPASASEAFLDPGRVRFDPEWVDAQAANLRPSLPRSSLPESLRAVPGLAVYGLPVGGRSYVVSADTAEGLEHGDYCDATVLDSVTWEEVASLHGRWEPDEFARYLMVLGNAYATPAAVGRVGEPRVAPVIVERNNHGHAVLTTMKLAGYRNIGLGPDDRPGWNTNVQSKPQMIDLLATALRDGLIRVRTAAALDELKVYRIKPDGSTGSPPNFNDDMVMSRAIALSYIRSAPAPRRVIAGANPLSGYRG